MSVGFDEEETFIRIAVYGANEKDSAGNWSTGLLDYTANPATNIVDSRGCDSSIVLI